MMPEKDGFEVCQTLKTDERTSHIPIVLLTAKADSASRLEGLGVGADAYLGKPFLKEELFIRLEQLVELRRKLQESYAGFDKVPKFVKSDTPTEPTLDDQFLQKIHELVIAKLNDADFGYDQIAQQMLLSRSQLFRKVKALTGQSVSNHIRRIRLHKGKELLENSRLTVSEIAYETGFTNPSYFSSSFSKEFGVSPSGIRK
jgi:AraC-like DNA-binding protein